LVQTLVLQQLPKGEDDRMQAQVVKDIIADMSAHMDSSKIPYKRWYVGITADIDTRLFGSHNVPRQGAWYIYRRAFSSEKARAVESAFHNAGCQGAGGGGDDTAVYVYAYVITETTVE
jgi:hypothetical protein